jgi:hypothetical protein
VGIGPAPISGGRAATTSGTLRPVSGRVAALAIDPGDVEHWLIGAAQGGVWATRDGGTTWTAMTDAAASLAMGAMAFAPSDPRIVYAGTGEAVLGGDAYGGAGILKSTDGGTTWQLLAASMFAGATFSGLQVDPSDPRRVVAATRGGGFGLGREAPPHSPDTGLVTSSDGGVTWSTKLIGRASALVVDPRDFRRQLAGIGAYACMASPPIPCVGTEPPHSVQNGVYRSTDAGESWTLIDGPWDSLPAAAGRVVLALAPSNPDVVYVSIQDALNNVGHDGELLGLWQTTDAWDATPSWSRIDTRATDDGTGVHGYCGWNTPNQEIEAQCAYDHTLLVHPSNPNVLYAGGVPLWRFDGVRWREISKPWRGPDSD